MFHSVDLPGKPNKQIIQCRPSLDTNKSNLWSLLSDETPYNEINYLSRTDCEESFCLKFDPFQTGIILHTQHKFRFAVKSK